MLLPSASERNSSLFLIEGALTVIAFAASFAWPRLASGWFRRIELAFMRLARRQGLAVAAVGITTLLLRLALLPLFPIPLPFAPDDFSNLLASDTFAHGRLANPTPAMWTHFESIHISMQPTYMSMYFPAQGLIMAAGKVLFGSPWFGILCVSALMCAAFCWMLQAWMPPGWALLGGILAMLRLGIFSYWVNTYTGAGLITGLGGALVLGALPRLMKTTRVRDGILMAVGIVLLALTRPYEGLLLCLPVAAALGHWAWFGKNRPAPSVLLRRTAVPLALIAAAMAWFGFYNYRAFGSPLTLPYTINRATYAMAPYFVWQSARPEPHYRHAAMRKFYYESELKAFNMSHTWAKFLPTLLMKTMITLRFFAGIALLPPLIMARRALHDRRIRFLVICLLVLIAGMVIEIFLIPHYVAPFTVVFYAIGLQAMRHLRLWKPEGKPVGLTLVRLSVSLCILMAGLRLFSAPLHMQVGEWPASEWSGMWYGPEHFGTERAQMEASLEQAPGEHLVIVRYSADHNPLDEWVYNAANIDSAKVVWAREMDAADNLELMQYYHGRKVWLAEPDTMPAALSQYPVPVQVAAVAH
jgi:hypothetical protein